jgi:hypothetical protein
MAGTGEIGYALPPELLAGLDTAPDLGSLQYPWDVPPASAPPVDAAAAGTAPPPPGPEPVGAPPPFDASLAGAPPPDLAPPAPPAEASPDVPPIAGAAPVDLTPPAPAALTPDALTSAGGQPPTGELGGQPYAPALTPDQGYAKVAANYAANPGQLLDKLIGGPIDADTQRYLNEFQQRDPAGFGEVVTRLGDAKLKHAAAEKARIQTEDHDREMANLARRQKSIDDAAKQSAAIDAEATAIANTKVGYHPTTLQRIAGVIAAVIGGLYQGKTGSARNPGLDALNDVIARDIEEQKQNLANRRDVIGMRRSSLSAAYARAGDQFQADEVARQAALKYADEQLAQQQLNFAPEGTRGLQIAQLRAGIAGQIATNRAAIQQKAFDNSIKLQTASREQQTADEVARNNRAQLGLGYARLDEERQQRSDARDARAAEKDAARQDKLDKQQLDRAIGGEVTPIRDAQGNVVGSKTGYITKADGSIWIPNGTEAQISDLQKQHAAATSLVQTLDAIRRVGPEWLSDTRNTEKAQRLKQLMGDARLQAIAAKNLGVPTGHDIELAENFIGTTDPTRWRDSVAGLIQGRESLVRDHNAVLRTHGLDKPWNPPDTSQPLAPKESEDDKWLKMLLDDPENVAKSNFDPTGAPRPARSDWEPYPSDSEAVKRGQGHPDARAYGVFLQKQRLDASAERARNGDPSAWREIADVAGRQKGVSAAKAADVRDYANQLLLQLQLTGINATPGAGAP